MTAPIVLHVSRTPFKFEDVVRANVRAPWPASGDQSTVFNRRTPGQLWERVAERQPRWGRPRARTAPVSSLYCSQCDYDDHTCYGCGEPLAHGQNCKEDHG